MGLKDSLSDLLSGHSDTDGGSQYKIKARNDKILGAGMLGTGSVMAMGASYVPQGYMMLDVIGGTLLAVGGFLIYMNGRTYDYDPDEAERYAKESLFKPFHGRSRIAQYFVDFYSRKAQEYRDSHR